MTASVQTDALLGKFAVLSYKSPAEVKAILADPTKYPEFVGWSVSETVRPKEVGGFYAYTFENPSTKQAVIAYRGTDGASDAGADRAIALGGWDNQFTSAIDYGGTVKSAYRSEGYTIFVTGHSLGGTLAGVTSQAYGYDGATLDPGAGKALTETPEFNAAVPNPVVIPSTFNNYNTYGSAVSGASGAHLGTVQYMPSQSFSGKDALVTGALTLLNPAVGITYGLTVDQFGNKHSSSQVSQALNLFSGTGLGDVSNLSMVPVTRQEPINGEAGGFRTVVVPGQFQVQDAGGNVVMTLKYTGDVSNRQLEVDYLNGTTKTITAPAPRTDGTNASIAVTETNAGTITSKSTITQTDDREYIAISKDLDNNGTNDFYEALVNAFDAEGNRTGESITTTQGNQTDRIILASVNGKNLEIDQHATATDAGPDGHLDDWDFTTTGVHITGQTGTGTIAAGTVNAAIDNSFDSGTTTTKLISGQYASSGNTDIQHVVASIDQTNPTGTTPSFIPASAINPNGTINWDKLLSDPKFQRDASDAVSLILAIRSGKPLAIASAGFNLLSHQSADPIIVGLSASLSGITSLKGLVDALEKGDLGRILIDGGGVARSAVTIYQNSLYEQLLDSTLNSGQLAAIQAQIDGATSLLGNIGTAVAVLNIINALAHGDIKGAVIGAVAMIPGWGTLAAAALQIADIVVQSLEPDHVFEGRGHYDIHPDGTFNFIVSPKGTPGTDDQDDKGGGTAVITTTNKILSSLQGEIQKLSTALGQTMGLIPERLPTLEFKDDQMFLRYKDASGETYFKSFDSMGNYLMPGFVEGIASRMPWGSNYHPNDLSAKGEGRYLNPADAVAGGEVATSDDFYKNIADQFYEAAIQSGAIAPQWEVDTATAANDSHWRKLA